MAAAGDGGEDESGDEGGDEDEDGGDDAPDCPTCPARTLEARVCRQHDRQGGWETPVANITQITRLSYYLFRQSLSLYLSLLTFSICFSLFTFSNSETAHVNIK